MLVSLRQHPLARDWLFHTDIFFSDKWNLHKPTDSGKPLDYVTTGRFTMTLQIHAYITEYALT